MSEVWGCLQALRTGSGWRHACSPPPICTVLPPTGSLATLKRALPALDSDRMPYSCHIAYPATLKRFCYSSKILLP